jgi:hypothetical protein
MCGRSVIECFRAEMGYCVNFKTLYRKNCLYFRLVT